jgi:hypothetical protein
MSVERRIPSRSTVESLRESQEALIGYVREQAQASRIAVADVTVSRFPTEVDVTVWSARDPGERGWNWAWRVSSDLQEAGLPISSIFRTLRERDAEEPARR